MPRPWQELSVEQSYELWRKTPDLVVLDVRSPEEFTGP